MQLVEAGGIELERPGAGQGVARQHRVGLPRYTELASKTQNFYPAFVLAAPVYLFCKQVCKGDCIEKCKENYLHWEIAEGNLHSLLFVGNLGVRTTSD